MAKTGRKPIPCDVAAAEVRALGYEPLQDYPGKTTTVWKMTCRECGFAWQSSLNEIRSGRRCPHRERTKLRRLELFGLVPVSPVPTDSRRVWQVRCGRCGSGMSVYIYKIKRGCRCAGDTWMAALAENELRDAGYIPRAPYPGSARKPWASVCAACGQDRNPCLTTIRAGKRCLHQTEEDKRRSPGTLVS